MRKIIAIAMMLSLAGCVASPAFAQTVPLQKSHSGLWADAGNITGSFDIQVVGDPGHTWAWATYFATTNEYDAPAQWLVAYPDWVGSLPDSAPLYRAVRGAGVELVQAGTVEFTPLACDALHARVVLWNRVTNVEIEYELTPLLLTSESACVKCDGFSPPLAECIE